MHAVTEPTHWSPHHRWRHRVSTRAFRWLSRRRIIKSRPGERYRINRHVVHLAALPSDLRGLTITHLSDLHVGPIVRPEHLPAIVDRVNEIGTDLIANTGDTLDYSNKYLPAVVEALAELRAPMGVYHVLGNHDYRDSPAEVIRSFRKADLNLLVNEHAVVEVNDHHIAVAGIDWAQREENIGRLVDHTCDAICHADLRVLLAHHPHALDAATRHGVDLVLSGHTHGGQFVLRKNRHGRESVGLGNMAFRYPQGHYRRGNTHLHVTNGIGGSFPLRYRCPAEISVLELQPG